jgi:hypothetical protein
MPGGSPPSPESSRKIVKTVGSLLPMIVPSALVGIFSRQQFPIRDSPRIEFRHERNREHSIAPAYMREFLRVSHVRDALMHGKDTRATRSE